MIVISHAHFRLVSTPIILKNVLLWRPARGDSHVARLKFKTPRVGVYKCLSLIVGFAVTVAIWPREVVSCRDFILCAIATFWAMSLVWIYPGRASFIVACCFGRTNIWGKFFSCQSDSPTISFCIKIEYSATMMQKCRLDWTLADCSHIQIWVNYP